MFDNARKTLRDWRRFRDAQEENRVRRWGQRLGAGTEQDPRSVRPETPPLVRPGFLAEPFPATPIRRQRAPVTLSARIVRRAADESITSLQFPTHRVIAPVRRARRDARIFSPAHADSSSVFVSAQNPQPRSCMMWIRT